MYKHTWPIKLILILIYWKITYFIIFYRLLNYHTPLRFQMNMSFLWFRCGILPVLYKRTSWAAGGQSWPYWRPGRWSVRPGKAPADQRSAPCRCSSSFSLHPKHHESAACPPVKPANQSSHQLTYLVYMFYLDIHLREKKIKDKTIYCSLFTDFWEC